MCGLLTVSTIRALAFRQGLASSSVQLRGTLSKEAALAPLWRGDSDAGPVANKAIRPVK